MNKELQKAFIKRSNLTNNFCNQETLGKDTHINLKQFLTLDIRQDTDDDLTLLKNCSFTVFK